MEWVNIAPAGSLGSGRCVRAEGLIGHSVSICSAEEHGEGVWHEISLTKLRQQRQVKIGNHVVYADVELSGPTRVLTLTQRALRQQAHSPPEDALTSSGLQINATLAGLGFVLIHEDGTSARPQVFERLTLEPPSRLFP